MKLKLLEIRYLAIYACIIQFSKYTQEKKLIFKFLNLNSLFIAVNIIYLNIPVQ